MPLLVTEEQMDSKEMSTVSQSDFEAYFFWDKVQKSSSLLSRCQECLEFCRRCFLFRFPPIKCPMVVNQAHPSTDSGVERHRLSCIVFPWSGWQSDPQPLPHTAWHICNTLNTQSSACDNTAAPDLQKLTLILTSCFPNIQNRIGTICREEAQVSCVLLRDKQHAHFLRNTE